MSRWDRKYFAVTEQLGAVAGTGVLVIAGTGEPLLPSLSPAQRAMAFAEAGALALQPLIYTATGGDDRLTDRICNKVDVRAGARAAIFLAHTLASISHRLAAPGGAGLHEDAHREAHALLVEYFPLDPDDARKIEDITRFDPSDLDAYASAFLDGFIHAMTILVGDTAPAMPGFIWARADPLSPEAYVGWLSATLLRQQAQRPYFDLLGIGLEADDAPNAAQRKDPGTSVAETFPPQEDPGTSSAETSPLYEDPGTSAAETFTRELDVACPVCDKRFRTRRQMEAHQRTRH